MCASLIDSDDKRGSDSFIEGERIVQAGQSASINRPRMRSNIDGTGKPLLPGLFDMHMHAQPLLVC